MSGEYILTVKRDHLFPRGVWHGFLQQTDFNFYYDIINQKKEFILRSDVECNPAYKQIIPYLVFTYNNTFFLMERASSTTEQRLRSRYSLGIGGHIRKKDTANTKTIFDWAQRELYEEITYGGNFIVQPIGIINDDSNSVGRVHIGFVFLLTGDSDAISVKSELKQGKLVSLDTCSSYYSCMESWSQYLLSFLDKCTQTM